MQRNSYEKMTIYLAVFCLCLGCVLFPCLGLIISGTASLSISGFAVDDSDRLYIGASKEIRVYEDGKQIGSISPHTSRAYIFTITDGDTILLSTSTTVYRMDLDGNVLETKDDAGADTYNQLSYRKRRFVSENGDTYEIASKLGRTAIIKNKNTVVYQMDALSYAVKLLVIICFLAMFGFAIHALLQRKKEGGYGK